MARAPTATLAAILAAASLLGACASPGTMLETSTGTVDRWQVWVCDVPVGSTHPLYADGPLGGGRVELGPGELAVVLAEHVTPWFERVSYGRHRLAFEAGGRVRLGPGDGPDGCVERALAGSTQGVAAPAAAPGGPVTGVLAVATAAHDERERGGFGRPGRPCDEPPCPAARTGRSAYVGAADFHPGWGPVPLLDLVEHELGHALGWGHSAIGPGGEYLSAIDLMSDSGGLRALDSEVRHGPPPLAEHRVAAGWIPAGDVRSLPPEHARSERVELAPVSRATGIRLLRLGVDASRWLAVEVLDDPLLAPVRPGVAVHLVGDGPAAPQVGDAPYVDLLAGGEAWRGHGWTVEVEPRSPGGDWRVIVSR